MVKEFSILVLGILLLTGFTFVHYLMHSNISSESLGRIVKITDFSSPSLSVAYYEPRVFLYDENSNPAYPQMQTMNKMDLIYGQ